MQRLPDFLYYAAALASSIQSVINIPANDITTVPVDNGCQIKKSIFLQIFFEQNNLHGKLTDLFSVFSFFLAFFGKFFPEIVFSLIIESKRSISKEFFLPVTKEIWLDMYFICILRTIFIFHDGIMMV